MHLDFNKWLQVFLLNCSFSDVELYYFLLTNHDRVADEQLLEAHRWILDDGGGELNVQRAEAFLIVLHNLANFHRKDNEYRLKYALLAKNDYKKDIICQE